MRFGSVCSGIEAASVAWLPLGWECVFVSELAAFPSRVLAHHYPEVPNHGDFTGIASPPPIDLLVGGTPCQSFSVAGLRGGLADERGNLALEFLRLADRARPRWVVWENVPGVLSSNGGRDFGAILGGLVELGYGFAYRVLDAQYFGVPQRRRRVFVVGCARGWAPAAAVLFERASLRRDSPPGRKAREDVAGSLGAGSARGGWGGDLDRQGAFIPIAKALTTRGGGRQDAETENFVAHLSRGGGFDVAHALRAEGFDASEDGTGRGVPLVPVAFDRAQITSQTNRSQPAPGKPAPTLGAENDVMIAFSAKDSGADAGELAPTLRSGNHNRSHPNGGVMPAVAFYGQQAGDSNLGMTEDGSPPLRTSQSIHMLERSAVRRLIPRECERLQGFPDDYTAIPGASDSARYHALGNSMAVPCMRRIGERIQRVDALLEVA